MSDLVGSVIGSIRIDARLGGGGMGEVYRGFDTRLERWVAVKTVRADRVRAAEFRQRFRREAKLIGKLGHPGICLVHDLIETPGADFLVMEYLEGSTLDRHVTTGFPRARLYSIFAQLANALAAAHGQHVVHRDLKPENIHIGAGDRAKILDFGIARSVVEGIEPLAAPAMSAEVFAIDTEISTAPHADETELLAAGSPTPAAATQVVGARLVGAEVYTGIGEVVGTRGYMSPEQAAGLQVGTASDIYALGLCLDSMLERCAKAGAEDAREAQSLTARMLAADPQRRPSAVEVERELERLIELPRQRVRLRLRRRLIVAAAMALLVLAAAMAWLAQDARRARAEADRRRDQAENLVEYLLGELREQLLGVGRVDLLDSVNQRAQGYLDAVGADDSAATRNARARLLGSRVAVLMQRGEYAEAERLAQAALAPAEAQAEARSEDPAALRNLAEVHYWLGYLAMEQMRPPAMAEAQFAPMVALRERVLALDPDGREARDELATALTSRAAATGARGPQALADLKRADALYRGMATAGDPGLMGAHASTLAWLSSAYEHAGDLPAAANARAENVAILTALKQADPANAVWSQDLAVALNFQMQLAQQLGRDDEALALVRRSCAMMDEDRRRDPQNREYQRGHAVCQSMLAGALLMAGQLADARAAALASVAALDTLVSEAGAQSDWPMQALAARLRLAEVDAADGRCAPALAALEAIEQHADGGSLTRLQRTRLRLLQGRCLAQQGDLAAAHAAYAQSVAELGEPGDDAPAIDLAYAAVAAIGMGDAARRALQLDRLRTRGYRGTLVREACARAGLSDCLEP